MFYGIEFYSNQKCWLLDIVKDLGGIKKVFGDPNLIDKAIKLLNDSSEKECRRIFNNDDYYRWTPQEVIQFIKEKEKCLLSYL